MQDAPQRANQSVKMKPGKKWFERANPGERRGSIRREWSERGGGVG